MTTNRDSMEIVGKAADEIDNLLAAMTLPMPPQFHLDAIKASLPDIRNRLQAVYLIETGENPWKDHP